MKVYDYTIYFVDGGKLVLTSVKTPIVFKKIFRRKFLRLNFTNINTQETTVYQINLNNVTQIEEKVRYERI